MSLDSQKVETQPSLQMNEQQCPQCQAFIPVFPGYPTWCDQCGWNLQVQEPSPFDNLFDKLYRATGQKLNQQLFEQMVKTKLLKPGWSFSKTLAFLLAGCVHGVTLIFIVLGIWLSTLGWPNLWGLIPGLPCFLFAWLLLPDLPKLPTQPLPRNQFPTLYQLTDRITQSLGSSPIDGIVWDIHFNAAFGQFGWKRKKILILGIPLFAILDEQEKVALLSHELAHGVNGDPSRSFFISAAIHSLATWYTIIYPHNRWHMSIGPIAILMFLINLVSLLLAGLIWLWAYILVHLLWRDKQRAEYLADFLAARVSGTDAQLATLEKVHLNETFRLSLKIAYLNREGQNFFTRFKQRIATVPSRELERIRRVEKLEYARLDATHPPTAQRIEFLKAHYVPETKVVLSLVELTQLEQELTLLQEEMQKELFTLDSLSFRSLFGLSW